MELTKEQLATALESDSDALMEQIQMQHSRHMRMSALVEYQLEYPDMTIREFFSMAAQDLKDQEEELGYYD
tara:strand:+ start:634 stop:846 length:213 start_codon:yes stop_codon:yes gene_type:complete